jgi:hypothetical protein
MQACSCPTELLVDDRIDLDFVKLVEETEVDCGYLSTINDADEISLVRLPRPEEP